MSDDRADRTRRIPRSESDDYSHTAVDDRRRWLEVETGARLEALTGVGADPHVFGAGLGISFHAANAVAALMLATGQDIAYLTAFTAITVMEALPAGDLYLSVDIPTLGVGTVGGGTGLPGARACLELLGCVGAGAANRLAEIAAATCLAGEASTVAAIVAGEFVAAHQTLGRNRPDLPSGPDGARCFF